MRCTAFVATGLLIMASRASGQGLPPITSRDYTLDIYNGAVLGSPQVVGMGGASIAVGEGSATVAFNPAAAAVRSPDAAGNWSGDFHIDWLYPGLSSDFDNNGLPASTANAAGYVSAGALVQYQAWGLAVSVEGVGYTITTETGGATAEARRADIGTTLGHVVLGRTFLDGELALAIGVRGGSLSMTDENDDKIFELGNAALEAGALWKPPGQKYRVGATAASRFSSGGGSGACEPDNCFGYILPKAVVVPGVLAAGVAYRFADSPWNQPPQQTVPDEFTVLVAFDLVMAGAVDNGYGLEAFVGKSLQESGRENTVAPRLGVQVEWPPGWIRWRAGSYFEPPRFAGRGGRSHSTGGVDVRLFQFELWGVHRLVLTLTSDVAADYRNAGASLGLW